MTQIEHALEYRRLRVPRGHHQVLVDPPLTDVDQMLAANRAGAARRADFDCHGRRLGDLADQTRRDLLRRARRYTTAYRDVRDVDHDDADATLIVSGHQPDLFHTGVWLKNLALGSLAARHDGLGIHLLIDNDAARQTTIQMPTGSPQRATVQAVPYDVPASEMPYEERRVLDRELFASFGSRVESTLAPLISQSMIREFWPSAVEAARENDNLGQCVSRARHQLEGRWGYQTLELPLSHVCRSESFQWLLADLLARSQQLHNVYNESLAEYRAAFRLRSRAHPVPDLTRRDEFLELPFWIWTTQDPQRRPLFVRRNGRRTIIRDLHSFEADLALEPDGDAAAAVGQLGKLTDRGVAIRPRALMTTMFVRLLLSDLFIHGIGGAKYDQLTDLLISRLFGGTAPGYLVVTGTALLEIPHEEVQIADIRRIDWLLRELTYHPERHLDEPADSPADAERISQIVSNKRLWIERQLPRGQRRARHLEISRANDELQSFVEKKRQELIGERKRLVEAHRNHRLLASREYAFCLFEEGPFRNWCMDLFPPSS